MRLHHPHEPAGMGWALVALLVLCSLLLAFLVGLEVQAALS